MCYIKELKNRKSPSFPFTYILSPRRERARVRGGEIGDLK